MIDFVILNTHQAKLKAVSTVKSVLPEASSPLIWISYSVLGATGGTGNVTLEAQTVPGFAVGDA